MKVLNRLLFVGAAAVVASIVKKNMDRKNAEADLWATATDSAAPAAPAAPTTPSAPMSEAGTGGASSPESAVDAAAGDVAAADAAAEDAWGEATDRP